MAESPGPTDRRPTLDQLIRAEDLRRCIEPFLQWNMEGMMLFDLDGLPYAGATRDDCPLARWEQLPAEARAAGPGPHAFGLDGRRFEVRLAYAGADRVGVLVFCGLQSAGESVGSGSQLQPLADALTAVLGQLLQAGFATWVTSELHLAASESSYLALQQQNAELQRAVEHLQELDKLKSNFLATVSHELRTPLTSIIGFSEMLLEGIAGELGDDQREYVTTILGRGEELLELITQILEMSRLEVGAVRLDLHPRDPAAMIERAISAVRIAADKAGVSVSSEVTPRAVPAVLVDADKIHRVLTNLLSNAIKFTKVGGGVVVRAELAPIRRPFEEETLFGAEDADAVRISVADTGIGIPSEQLERIFEAFYQVDASSTREHGGAGLGLSIVRSLVGAHGGEIWAQHGADRVGTVFHFTLPVASET